MPKLVKLYIRHVLIGFGISAVFVTSLLVLNVANLWGLVSSSPVGLIAAFMLFMSNGIVFAGVQFAIAVMRMADTDDQGPKGRRMPITRHTPALVPIPVEGKASKRVKFQR